MVDGDDEHGQPPVLGHFPVGAGQHEGVVGPLGERAPNLGPVDDELIAVPVGPSQGTGHVGAAAGLGNELHPQLVAPDPRRDVALFLLLGAELQYDRPADRQGGNAEQDGHVEVHAHVVDDLLVGGSKALASVLLGVAHRGVPPVIQPPLKLTVAAAVQVIVLGGVPGIDGVATGHVLVHPRLDLLSVPVQLGRIGFGIHEVVHRSP